MCSNKIPKTKKITQSSQSNSKTYPNNYKYLYLGCPNAENMRNATIFY